MPTIQKIVTSSLNHSNLIKRERAFEGLAGLMYYTDQWNAGPASTYTFANQRETAQPSDWNYRDRIRRHLNATTYLQGEKWIIEKPSNSWEAHWQLKRWTGETKAQSDKGSFGFPRYTSAPLTPGFSENPDAALEAKYRLYSVLKDKRQAWEGMVFLGELRELIRMVRRPASNLRDGLSEWVNGAKKHRSRSGTAATNRALAGSWLEWVYGVSPTIGDLENAKEALNRHLERYENLYQRFASWSEDTKSLVSGYTNQTLTYYPWQLDSRFRKYVTSKVGYYGQVYTAASHTEGFTRQQLGFELRNFAPTVWELIPYSFVADYFTNIGNVISALSTHTGDVAWVSTTAINEGVMEHWPVRAFVRDNLSSNVSAVSGLRVYSSLTSPLIVRRRKVTRLGLSSVPIVNPFKDFRVKLPEVGSTKWINLLALVSASRTTERLLRGS